MKKFIFFLTYITGINKIFYFLNKKNQLILTFHNIIPDEIYDDSPHLLVSYKESLFAKHIKHIKKNFNITTKIGEPNSCVITFDDGYQNNYLVAHEILKKEKIKAIFFIPVNREVLWIDKILMWISYIPEGEYNIFNKNFKIKNNLDRKKILEKIWKVLLENYNPNEILNLLDNCYNFFNIKLSDKLKTLRFSPLTADQIEKMKSFGHLIGCHSVNHDILSKLNNNELKNDIKLCEKNLKKMYNCLFFSYPFGSESEVSKNVIEILKKSKFQFAFMNINHPFFNYSKYAIPRTMLLPEEYSVFEIDAMLSGLRYFIRYKKLFPKVKF